MPGKIRVRRRVRRKPGSAKPTAAGVHRRGAGAPLLVGGARDPAEAAADRMANAVLAGRSVAPPGMAAAPPRVQRKCAACAAADAADPEKDEIAVRRVAAAAPALASGAAAAPAPLAAARALAQLGPGRALGKAERAYFEPRFGRDLSAVRVHEGIAAARAARTLSARALAHGSDIAFAGGRDTARDPTLMAHELAHVVRGGNAARRAPIVRRTCEDCASRPDPVLDVKIRPLVSFGTPPNSRFGETFANTYRTRQVSVWQREVRTCDSCPTSRGTRPVWEVCPRRIKVLGTVGITVNPTEIRRTAGNRAWWTECGAGNLGRDRFLSPTDASAEFTDPKRKTVAGVIHHERYHASVLERMLRDHIATRTDVLPQCPYDAEAIASWKSTLEAALRADADATVPPLPLEPNEEANATRAECSRY